MYQLLMFSVLLSNFFRLLPGLLLFLAYLMSLSVFVLFFNDTNFSFKNAFLHPVDTVTYLYVYLKWWIAHRDELGFFQSFYLFISFFLPFAFYFVFKSLFKLSKKMCNFLIRKIIAKLKRKKERINPKKQEHSQNEAAFIKAKMMRIAEAKIDEYLCKKKSNSD